MVQPYGLQCQKTYEFQGQTYGSTCGFQGQTIYDFQGQQWAQVVSSASRSTGTGVLAQG